MDWLRVRAHDGAGCFEEQTPWPALVLVYHFEATTAQARTLCTLRASQRPSSLSTLEATESNASVASPGLRLGSTRSNPVLILPESSNV